MGKKGAWRRETERCIQQALDAAERSSALYIPSKRSTLNACRRRCETGGLVEPQLGMFARLSFWKTLKPNVRALCILRGLQAQHPKWVFCNISAAAAYGLPVSVVHLNTSHVVFSVHTRLDGRLRVCGHVMTAIPVAQTMGLRVTSLSQTVLDCTCELSFCEALAVADACLRNYSISKAELQAFVTQAGRGRHGIVNARRVLKYADGLSESWGESVARGLMIQLGFALPELQAVIELPQSLGGSRRVDFLWRLPDGRIIIGEFDGKVKYRDKSMLGERDVVEVLVDERQRESRLTVTRAAVVRFTYDDLRDPERFATLLNAYGVPRAGVRAAA